MWQCCGCSTVEVGIDEEVPMKEIQNDQIDPPTLLTDRLHRVAQKQSQGAGLAPKLHDTVELPSVEHVLPFSAAEDMEEANASTPKSIPQKIEEAILAEDAPAEQERKMRLSVCKARDLCKEGRSLDAYAELAALEAELVEETAGEGASLNKRSSLRSLAQELAAAVAVDPQLRTLRAVHEKDADLENAISKLALATTDGKSWTTAEVKSDKISSQFSIEIKLRFAEDSERDPNGPKTQFIGLARTQNWVLPLDKSIASDRETDLIQKEFIQGCRKVSGVVTGPENLNASMLHTEISFPLLPVVLDQVIVRRYCVCPKPPCANVGPGVLKVERTPPTNASSHDGFDIPAPGRRVVRMEAKNIMYYTPGSQPGTCDVLAVVEGGLPLPQWMVPISLLSKMSADFFMNTLIHVKEKVADSWTDHGFDERMTSNPEFYAAIGELQKK